MLLLKILLVAALCTGIAIVCCLVSNLLEKKTEIKGTAQLYLRSDLIPCYLTNGYTYWYYNGVTIEKLDEKPAELGD